MGGCYGTEDLNPECGKENLNPETSRLEKSRPEVNRAETEKNSIGKYKVLRLLGEGGEGSVYLARDEDLQRMAAVKHLGKSRREAEWLQKLEHPMLPVIYELLWDESWYLVMEYIRGITLRRYIDENGYACEEQVCTWIEQLLDVTEYLHTMKPPVIYRDFKPDNIIVCPDGHIRLVDFGAAVLRNYGSQDHIVMAVTQGYAAPEQLGLTGIGAYADERSDIYALGKVLYYMMTGADPAKPPYASLPVQDYQPFVSKKLERVIRKCMEEDPAQRYRSAEEVRTHLRKCKKRKYGLQRRHFIRGVEKKVWLTEMQEEICYYPYRRDYLNRNVNRNNE